MSFASAVRALEAARDEYVTAVKDSELAHVVDFFAHYLRPAVYVETAKELSMEMKTGCSRFGGVPDLPRGTEWPTHAHGAYRFFAQLNLAEMPTLPLDALSISSRSASDAPALHYQDELLSFFVAETPDWDIFWQDDGFVKALYTPREQFADLVPVKPPADAVFAEYHPAGCLPISSFHVGCQPPFRKECVHPPSAWPLTKEETDSYAYETLISTLRPTPNYLLGYPSYCTLGYDPTPEPREDYVHLLGLISIDCLNWCWHDGDRLSVFIKREDLIRGDFSSLKCDAG